MTLWGRIASGVKSGLSKTAGHDVDYFVNAVLEHIRADASRAVANDRLTALIGRLQSLEPEEQSAWLQCLGSHLIPFLTRARVAWIERRDARQTADPGQEVSP